MNWKIIFNPFSKYSETQLLIAGIVITILGSLVGSHFDVSFDGVLDVHVNENTFLSSVTENLINIFSVIAVLFILGKIINSKTRFIDILNMTMLSRIPLYLLGTITNNSKINDITQKIIDSIDYPQKMNLLPEEMAILAVFTVVSFLMMAYFIVLLIFGFKTATNTKKWQHWIFFAVTIILAEIISKSLL